MSEEPDIEDLFPLVCDGIAAKLGIQPRGKRPWTQEEQDRISAEFDSPNFTLSDDLFDPPQTGHSPHQRLPAGEDAEGEARSRADSVS